MSGRSYSLPDMADSSDAIQPIEPPETTAPGDDPADCVRAANEVLAGEFTVFGVRVPLNDGVPGWNRDPLTGVVSPMDFGPTLDYRDEQLVGDIKCLWEPNRHLQLVTLAQAARITGDNKYTEGLDRFLGSWLDQCPYLRGPNWTSSLELAIRLINWSLVWRILDCGKLPPLDESGEGSLRRRLFNSVYQHCFFVSHHYSRFSSANNHLIGEAAGVFVASCTWPDIPGMNQLRDEATQILTEEFERQTTSDGFNAELSTAYHEFVMQFGLACLLAADASGHDLPDSFTGAMSRMAACADLLKDVAGNAPMFGDADDGHVFRLSYAPGFDSFRSTVLASYALLGPTSAAPQVPDAQAKWLLTERQIQALDDVGHGHAARGDALLDDTGYYLLGRDLGTAGEIRLWFDAGKLGFLSIAAHGHADALSVYLAAFGEEILIDPGTYAYHTRKAWRDYFRGTSAHNTVCVDMLDQSVSGGNFMWNLHANAEVTDLQSGSDKSVIAARHDGYKRLDDPVIHSRTVTFDKVNREIVIEDLIHCEREHTVDIHWHLAERIELAVASTDQSWCVRGSRVSAEFSVTSDRGPVELATAFGQENPPSGWVSRHFSVKEETNTVRVRQNITGRTTFTTRIAIRKRVK